MSASSGALKSTQFLTKPDLNALAIHVLIKANFMPINPSHTKPVNWGITYQEKMYSQQIPLLPDMAPIKKLRDILEAEDVNLQFYFTTDTKERIKPSKAVNPYGNGVAILYNQEGGSRLSYTIFGNGTSSTLTAFTSRYYERYQLGDKYRQLTPVPD